MLYASFEGIIQDADKPACPDIVIPFEEETEANSGHLERNVFPATRDQRYIENMQRCESTHWFIKDGITVTYPGKLYLD